MTLPMWTNLLVVFLFPVIHAANLICYFPNWPAYRQGGGKHTVDNIDVNLCSHYIYAFTVLDGASYTIKIFDPQVDVVNKGFEKFSGLKSQNGNLKMMVAIGGWTDSKDPNDPTKYSRLVSNPANIDTFVRSAVGFLQQYDFDGLDLDWEYPSSSADRQGFSQLVSSLKRAFQPRGYLLSAAVSAAEWNTGGYDVPSLNQNLDILNLMTYDYHGSWESTVDHHSPLYKRPTDASPSWNSDFGVNHWIKNGFEPSKIYMGVPLYGKSWTLSSSATTPQAPASGAGAAGPITGEPGTLAYYEICNNVRNNGWIKVEDPSKSIGPYAISPNSPKTWVGYDDPAMAVVKTNYALSKGLGGIMVWDVSMDDFRNTCGDGVYPILNAILSTLKGSTRVPQQPIPQETAPTPVQVGAPVVSLIPSGMFSCPNPNGIFADPASCSNFYSCANGFPFKMACPAGLNYNSRISACDWPANVNCS